MAHLESTLLEQLLQRSVLEEVFQGLSNFAVEQVKSPRYKLHLLSSGL